MTNGSSLEKRRNILLPFIFLLVAYVFLSIFSIKTSFWILVIVAIVATLFIALSYRLKSSTSSTAETAEVVGTTESQEKKSFWDSYPMIVLMMIVTAVGIGCLLWSIAGLLGLF